MLRMSGATLTDKPNLVHEDEDEFDYDEVCEKLNFYFVREPADKDDSALRAVKPSFVHQVYDSRDKLALLKEISRIEIIVDCTTWISHIAVYSKDERLSDDSGASMAIVQPIIDKLSTGKA